MSSPAIRFQRTYVTLADADLRKVYIRDTIVVDDTGAGTADVPLLLPKIGTAYAPVGLRITIVKPSNATHAVAITPQSPDAISSGTLGPFPDFAPAGTANDSALPSGTPGAVWLEATDMNLVGSVQPNPSGGTPTTAGAWLAIGSGGGGGSSSGGLGKYWVNAPGKSPLADYTTIQAGVDAAHADRIAEGNTGTYDVFVLPGNTFTENVILPEGINLVGLQGSANALPPILNGTLTSDTAADQTQTITGLAILGQVTATGTHRINWKFRQCLISVASGDGFLDNNSDGSSEYGFTDTSISSGDAAGFAIAMGSTGSLFAERCNIGSNVARHALIVAGANGSSIVFRGCVFKGSRELAGASTGVAFYDCDFDCDALQASLTLAAGSQVLLSNYIERGQASPVWAGTGTIVREGTATFTSAVVISTTIVTAMQAVNDLPVKRKPYAGLGPHAITTDANFNIYTPGGGNSVANLPALLSVPDGSRWSHKNTDPVASIVTLTAFAGSSIDGQATFVLVDECELIVDHATTAWLVSNE